MTFKAHPSSFLSLLFVSHKLDPLPAHVISLHKHKKFRYSHHVRAPRVSTAPGRGHWPTVFVAFLALTAMTQLRMKVSGPLGCPVPAPRSQQREEWLAPTPHWGSVFSRRIPPVAGPRRPEPLGFIPSDSTGGGGSEGRAECPNHIAVPVPGSSRARSAH